MSGETTSVSPSSSQRGQLVAEALAAAGGKDRQHRPALQQPRDGGFLAVAKGVEAKDLAERLPRGFRRRRGIGGWRGWSWRPSF